uniref:Uncharacterized protein n=1 Tax=Fagus sylvatica TaxID=28930 RepID=A0A2N9EFC6_FAGSY
MVVDGWKWAWVCRSQPRLADLDVVVCLHRSRPGLAVLDDLAWWSGGCCWVLDVGFVTWWSGGLLIVHIDLDIVV